MAQVTIVVPDDYIAQVRAAHDRRMERVPKEQRAAFDFGPDFVRRAIIASLQAVLIQDARETADEQFQAAVTVIGEVVTPLMAPAAGDTLTERPGPV